MYLFPRGHLDIRAVSALTLQFHIAIPWQAKRGEHMNRKNTWAAALGCLLLLSLSGIAAAIDDEEDSLVTRLAERVEELFGRVERLEGLWEGPGPAYLDSGNCVIAAVEPMQYKRVLQNETIL